MATTITQITIGTIETKCRDYASRRAQLADRNAEFKDALQAVYRTYLPRLKAASASCAGLEAEIRADIEASPELFQKPRTLVLNGVKCGFAKGKGSLSWDCEDEDLVKRIRKQCAQDLQELLINTTYKPSKKALESLPADALKRLGISVSDAGDKVVVQIPETNVEKFVSKLMDELVKNIEDAG
jgi:hypothetical protein